MRRGYQAPGSQRYRGLLLAMTCWTSCSLGATRWRAGRGGRRLKFVNVRNASTTPTRVCRTRRGIGSPQPRFSACCARGRFGRRLLSAAAAAGLPIRRSRSTSARTWAPAGWWRRRWSFIIKIGRFFTGVVVYLNRSRFETCESNQFYALAGNMNAESRWGAGMNSIGTGVGCCKCRENASAKNENVGAAG